MKKKGVKNRFRTNIMLIFVCCLALTFVLPLPRCLADTQTIYVDDSNTTGPWDGTTEYPYKSISEGIQAANESDIVYVISGTYNERLTIIKNLILTGENKDTTIIDGGNNGHTVYVSGTSENQIHVDISGFTIRNAGGLGYDCIAYSYATSSTINGNNIMDSEQSDGIQLDHCFDITIQNNMISENSGGAGISITLSEQIEILHNTLQDNQKGVYIYYSNSNEIYDNTITGNTQFGAYVVSSSSGNIFSLNDFTNNGQNVQDSCINSWSSNEKGNYWDDYNDYDSNGDGIGDSPYLVSGGTNKDDYPLGYFTQPDPPGGGENQPPVAYLPSVTPNPAVFGQTVYFTGAGVDSDGYIIQYSWRSSLDGIFSDQKTPSSSTLSIGSHTIYFKVQDNSGAWSGEKTVALSITQSQNKIPTAHIDSISPNPVDYGKPIRFSGYGIDLDGSIAAWKWISNLDGEIGSQPSFTSITLSVGTHTISFQVKDNDNVWSNVTQREIFVRSLSAADPWNQPPVADTGGPYTGSVNTDITFNGSGSYETNGTITLYQWTYDDGFSGTGISPSHQYTTPGTYTVTLEVTDDDGETSTSSTTVTITESSQGSGGIGELLSQLNVSFPILLSLGGIGIMLLVILGVLMWLKRMR